MRNTTQNIIFQDIVKEIKTSNVYENHKNWERRGLIPSDQHTINLLRTSTNKFLDELESINRSDDAIETQLNQISDLVDDLPWLELDTEEKEFLADTLAPAIKMAGFDPWAIF